MAILLLLACADMYAYFGIGLYVSGAEAVSCRLHKRV